MDNESYLIRENNTQKVYLTEGIIDVVDLLKETYGYICDSIADEDFILKSRQCNMFKELVFNNYVVGFCSYDFSREFLTAALNNIYILPEFRGKGLFKQELLKTMEEHHKPSIVEPTRLIVEILIKYGFAQKIDDHIVASAIEFITPGDHVLSNSDYASNEELSTHFYDLDICASIHFLDKENNYFAYSAPLNYDIMHYDCLDYEIDGEYIEKIKKTFVDNEKNLIEVILSLEENLPLKTYTLEEVIGEADSLSVYIESLIDDAHITYDDAIKIKNQIREEYEAGMIINESLMIRLAYLFGQNSDVNTTSHNEKCPYCNMPIDDHDAYCHFCGINLNYNPNEVFDSLVNTFTESPSDCEEDIRYIAFKFLKLIMENIPFEYCVFTIENTYDIYWSVLERYLRENHLIYKYKITDEGLKFMESHPLNYYEKYSMDIVNYTDFENYFYSHPDLDGKTICINYLKQFNQDEDIIEILSKLYQ